MRSWLSTAVLAWVTAVLMASPVLAGRSCLECCQGQKRQAAAGHCEHCPARPSLTAAFGERCQSCPKCESSRPSPVTPASTVNHWLPADDLVYAIAPAAPVAMVSGLSTGTLEQTAGIVPHPPLQILYCTWLN